MGKAHTRSGEFRKVGENLYRYSSSGIYYVRFRHLGKEICRSLRTKDREFAKRRLQDEIDRTSKIDPKSSSMTMSELLRLYEEKISQYAPKTTATRRSILKSFKETWKHGLEIPIKNVSTGQIALWLASRRPDFKNATYNEYARFIRHVFELAMKMRALPESPAAGIKGPKVETPIRLSPTWEQFRAIVKIFVPSDLTLTPKTPQTWLNSWVWPERELRNMPTSERNTLISRPIELPYTERRPTQDIPFPFSLSLGACRRLGFPHFSARALRRCFITRAIELGVDFKTIAAWQGHRDGGVLVAKTYSHLRSEHSGAMAKKLQVPA